MIRSRVLMVAAACWLASGGCALWAQIHVTPAPVPLLSWDHDGVAVETWTLTVDGQPPLTVRPTAPAVLPVGWILALPEVALTRGPHSLTVSACNVSGCGVSDPLSIVVDPTAPGKPASIRIVRP